MSASLAEDFALVLADLRRMEFDNADPMRYAKRQTKEAALRILQDAVACAQQMARLPKLISDDFKEATQAVQSRIISAKQAPAADAWPGSPGTA